MFERQEAIDTKQYHTDIILSYFIFPFLTEKPDWNNIQAGKFYVEAQRKMISQGSIWIESITDKSEQRNDIHAGNFQQNILVDHDVPLCV